MHLESQGITCELLDLRTLRPLDLAAIVASVRRTGRLLALDCGCATGSIAHDILAKVTEACWSSLQAAPRALAQPDFPEATSSALIRQYHVRAEHIVDAVGAMLGVPVESRSLAERRTHPHDVPGHWFSGPF